MDSEDVIVMCNTQGQNVLILLLEECTIDMGYTYHNS